MGPHQALIGDAQSTLGTLTARGERIIYDLDSKRRRQTAVDGLNGAIHCWSYLAGSRTDKRQRRGCEGTRLTSGGFWGPVRPGRDQDKRADMTQWKVTKGVKWEVRVDLRGR